jgi:hypothetical protein
MRPVISLCGYLRRAIRGAPQPSHAGGKLAILDLVGYRAMRLKCGSINLRACGSNWPGPRTRSRLGGARQLPPGRAKEATKSEGTQ